ncbi:MAG: DUF5666 domain-containing protein [Candidatus Anstonellales archaeon]
MKNGKMIATIAVLILLVGGGSFFAGMKYQQPKRPQGRFGNFQGQAGQFGQRQGFRPVNGEIISVDDKSITVKLADNSSKIVLLTDTTTINKTSPGSKEDLKVGEKVAAFGTENSDGSVTAQNIQINPILRGMPGGGSSAN